MSTIQEKIDRLRRYKGDMKEAINGRHSTVPVNENMAQYSAGIWGIPEGGGGDDKDYRDNPKPDRNIVYYWYTASDRTVYYGSSVRDSGLYAIKNGVATKLISNGRQWQFFFEASDGTVYVSSSYSYSDGLYAIKDGVTTQIITTKFGWQYFLEASDGTVYVGGDGLYAIKDGVATQMFPNGSNWSYFFEASDGTIYVSGGGSNSGLYAIKNGVKTQIISNGRQWKYFFEASDGTVYVSSSSDSGIYAIKNGVATKLISTGSYWQFFFEASDGTVYVGGSDNRGIYAIKDGVATQIITTGSYLGAFCELSNGIVLVGSIYNVGLYAIKDGVATQLSANVQCAKIIPIETEDNITVYITGTGVKVIQYNKSESSWGDLTTPIASGVYDYVKPVPSTGEIMCSSSTENGIYIVNRSTSVQIHNSEQYNWMLYNDTFISADRDHQYQYDDTDTLNPVKERTIELPESPKCFITIAKQNTYDV